MCIHKHFNFFLIFIVFGDVEDSSHVWVPVADLETLREILVDIKQSTLAQRGMGLLQLIEQPRGRIAITERLLQLRLASIEGSHPHSSLGVT